MKKELKDYLPFYLGCEVFDEYDNDYKLLDAVCKKSANVCYLISVNRITHKRTFDEVKPILRPLSDITKHEAIQVGFYKEKKEWHEQTFEQFIERIKRNEKFVNENSIEIEFTPNEFSFFVSKGFDLFGLIESGLAINSLTINDVSER